MGILIPEVLAMQSYHKYIIMQSFSCCMTHDDIERRNRHNTYANIIAGIAYAILYVFSTMTIFETIYFGLICFLLYDFCMFAINRICNRLRRKQLKKNMHGYVCSLLNKTDDDIYSTVLKTAICYANFIENINSSPPTMDCTAEAGLNYLKTCYGLGVLQAKNKIGLIEKILVHAGGMSVPDDIQIITIPESYMTAKMAGEDDKKVADELENSLFETDSGIVAKAREKISDEYKTALSPLNAELSDKYSCIAQKGNMLLDKASGNKFMMEKANQTFSVYFQELNELLSAYICGSSDDPNRAEKENTISEIMDLLEQHIDSLDREMERLSDFQFNVSASVLMDELKKKLKKQEDK